MGHGLGIPTVFVYRIKNPKITFVRHLRLPWIPLAENDHRRAHSLAKMDYMDQNTLHYLYALQAF